MMRCHSLGSDQASALTMIIPENGPVKYRSGGGLPPLIRRGISSFVNRKPHHTLLIGARLRNVSRI